MNKIPFASKACRIACARAGSTDSPASNRAMLAATLRCSRAAWPQKKMDDRFGDYLVATCNAVRRLVRTPAPDLEALGVKIALVVDERGWGLTGGERCMAVLKADAGRLLRRSSC